jgi:large subunit ribosomal protein L28
MRERACDISGSRRNKANSVSKSNAHTRKFQLVNLQSRKLWWPEGDTFVRLRISTRTLKTIKKNGLHATAKKHGIDLSDFAVLQDTPPGTMPNVRPPRALREEVLSV